VCRYGDLDRVTNLEIQETQVQLLRARKQVGSTGAIAGEGRKEGEGRRGKGDGREKGASTQEKRKRCALGSLLIRRSQKEKKIHKESDSSHKPAQGNLCRSDNAAGYARLSV